MPDTTVVIPSFTNKIKMTAAKATITLRSKSAQTYQHMKTMKLADWGSVAAIVGCIAWMTDKAIRKPSKS